MKKIITRNKDFHSFLLIGLSVIFLVVNLQVLFPWHLYNSNNFDDETPEGADFVYYLDGAKSIAEFHLFKKLNNKKQPIVAARSVNKNDLKSYYDWVAIAYPNPSFKFGYSLISAIVTYTIPDIFFEKIIPRLAFANLVFAFAIIILIYYIVYDITKSYMCSFFSVLFQIFDNFNIHNNFAYMSHTSSGLLFSLIASLLILKSNPSSLSLFSVGMCLVFASLCSSHMLVFNISLFFLYLLFYFKNIFPTNRKIKPIIFYLLGALFWPIYILIVENVCQFKQIGIPTFLEQYKGYSQGVKSLIATYSIFERQIWDLSLWNFSFYPLLLISFIILWKRKNKLLKYFRENKGAADAKAIILLISAAIFVAMNCFVSQPIIRAIVPSLIFLNIIFGCLVGSVLNQGPVWKVFVILVVFSLVINFELYNTVINKNIKALTATRLVNSRKIVQLSGQDEFWKYTHIFYKKGGNYKIPQGIYKNFSMSVSDYAKSVHNQIDSENQFLELNPMDLIEAYSHSRRWIPQFQPLRENIATERTIQNDFKLFFEIFELAKESKVNIYCERVLCWNPIMFDQEYNYIYGVKGKVKPYLVGTSLEGLDFKSIYYVKISDIISAGKAGKK